MPLDLYLHAGTHKTATTALQRFLAQNQEHLSPRLVYPQTGRERSTAHHCLFSSVRTPVHPRFQPAQSFEGYIANLDDELHSCDRAVLSSEILSEKVDLEALKKFSRISDRVRIVVYVRPQYAYIASLYGELVRNGRWRWPLSESVRQIKANWYETCQQWAAVFGHDNVIVRPFEKSRFIGGSVFSDFLDIFDIPLTDAYVLPDSAVNPSLPREAIEFKRAVNFLALSDDELLALRTCLIQYYRTQNRGRVDPTDWLSETERRAIAETYEASNRRLAVEFLDRERSYLFLDNGQGGRTDAGAPEELGTLCERMSGIFEYLRLENEGLYRTIKRFVCQRSVYVDSATAEAVARLRRAL